MEGHHHNSTQPQFSDLIVAKSVSILVLGLASFAIGIIPIKLTKLMNFKAETKDKNLVISLLLCFGGGVLLFTTFIHLQPEVREAFEHLDKEGRIPAAFGHGIPASELVFCFGFFFVYLIEEVVHFFLDKKIDHTALHRSLSVKCNNKRDNLTIPRVTLNKIDDTGISYISTSTKELLTSQSNLNYLSCSSSQSDEHTGHTHFDVTTKNPVRGFLTVLALSFHAVFEGLAVGLESNTQRVWYLFAAIATHKLVIAFCVGIELVVANTKKTLLFVYIGTFALVTPLGIGIGIFLSKKGGSEEDLPSVILQGMAAGTLLYVVFFEVLARERSNRHSGFWQLIAIILGFGVMFGLQFLTGHEHSSSSDHHLHNGKEIHVH